MIFSDINSHIDKALATDIPEDRLQVLDTLIDFCQNQLNASKPLNLNFICTHNSRRSQFSQIWGQTAAAHFGIDASCFSGGVEVTAFNERAVASMQRMGFQITAEPSANPQYSVQYSDSHPPLVAFSKVFDDEANPNSEFAAVMTCSDADENCPFIPGAMARIPLRYEDPKAFDGTDLETEMYDQRSMQIASELLYVFGKLNQ